MNTEELVSKSVYILRETKSNFKNPVILWSTGKNSTLSLSLCREGFLGSVPFPVMHIDTGLQFDQMYKFRDKIAKDWNLDLIVEKNDKAGKISPSQETCHKICCQTLKTETLRDAIEKHGFDAVIVSICRDQKPTRNSIRTHGFNLQTYFGTASQHILIHPIRHWSEIDIWEYTKTREIPVNPLYFAKAGFRYRSLDCYPCTKPIKSSAKNIDEIIEELKSTKVPERSTKLKNKDKEEIMRRLRAMGYM